MSRKYRLGRRAESVDDTRRRITDAAIALHGSIGPARTTISAVATRAGVQRLTVYRHFPDESALFRACSGQWIADHPPPDASRWTSIANPAERIEEALRELYAYFERTAGMWERIYRDAPLVRALDEPFAGWHAYLAAARGILAVGWGARGARRRRLEAAIAHAIDFSTWSSLTRSGARAEDAVTLMAGMVRAAGTSTTGLLPAERALPAELPERRARLRPFGGYDGQADSGCS